MSGVEGLPVGRRVAYWRSRRKLSQQQFADRLGKSKSWVDKVERGVRSLDRVSTLQDIAAVLRIAPGALLGADAATPPAEVAGRAPGVERIRAALCRYEAPLDRPAGRRPVLTVERLGREVAHAWTSFQYARYPQLIGQLPDLLGDAQRTCLRQPEAGRGPLVETYRVTAAVLVKVGVPELGWLVADRAMHAAAGDRELVAAVAVQLGQVLRAAGRAGEAVSVLRAAAYRVAPPVLEYGLPAELSLCGALLTQAALAAAQHGDEPAATELIDEAAGMARRIGDGRDHYRTGFGPTSVDLARTAAAVESGDVRGAIGWHERTVRRDGWRWLPAEHRAAHLLDTVRAYLHVDDVTNAARALVDAERTAPAEVRHRPAGLDVLARLAREPHAPGTVTRLAVTLGVG
ncbi:helix-turn-helix domain-containing protein [Micromonospora sp. WMMD882]|uniref:helix-turn-helix domain-containing protein n=1 Tax=Micromonospora sp. WMMD882 TaxID=3015151 RepID=UPI00248BF1A8|nr:helix-turn-helix domain-containing protein [Micromonospora sp. WMMD882]WBB77748.1 helix-turn-helix domain-containing protein [Micromonospora sp. WMMD882]